MTRRSIKHNSVFKCPSCKSSNYQVFCSGGWWEICNKDDLGAVLFNTQCLHCNYEGTVYMKGAAFPQHNDAAPAFHGVNL